MWCQVAGCRVSEQGEAKNLFNLFRLWGAKRECVLTACMGKVAYTETTER